MSESPKPPASTGSKMEKLVALCRRRGFVFQSSEIYGGINGFWDYGPLGVELKKNLKDAWWHDIVRCPANGPDGSPLEMVGLDCTIIMNPKVWVASGHATGFNDPMVDCRSCKQRFRADHVWIVAFANHGEWIDYTQKTQKWDNLEGDATRALFMGMGNPNKPLTAENQRDRNEILRLNSALRPPEPNTFKRAVVSSDAANVLESIELTSRQRKELEKRDFVPIYFYKLGDVILDNGKNPCPNCGEENSLTEPRQFNLMFKTHVGALESDDSMAYLRPETAQGIFANFRNVTDTSRVKVPFGIAQIGKAFRNEVTPRNFTFRSREFEQMEIEFFINPATANEWYKYWRDSRFAWWQSIGLSSSNLQLREHDKDELAHYAKEGAGTSDIEYKFPFTDPGYGELEGVAHRADFDLKAHAQHSGLGDKLKYFDQELQVKLLGQGVPKEEVDKQSKYFPHVIEPSAGADRGTLALLCEAYTDDPGRPSGVVMKFHPRMAPIKAAIFPLVDKDGMPEIAENLYRDLRKTWNVQLDVKQNIGKRYARMDEAGTPFCFTIDTQTLQDQTVTVRHRDTLAQDRVALTQVRQFLADKIDG